MCIQYFFVFFFLFFFFNDTATTEIYTLSLHDALPIALLASFVGPGFRLALKDRRAEPRLVQGQLVGASSVSTSMGLGMMMVQTRGGVEQYLVSPSRLKQVPGNQVNIVLTVTPHLKHVKSVGGMGQRMVG